MLTTIIINIIVTAMVGIATALATVSIIIRRHAEEYRQERLKLYKRKYDANYESTEELLLDFFDRTRYLKITSDKEYVIKMVQPQHKGLFHFIINGTTVSVNYGVEDYHYKLFLYYPSENDENKKRLVFDKGVLDIPALSSVLLKSYSKRLKIIQFTRDYINNNGQTEKDENDR